MSQLIQIRQRLKAVATIKKITHAMRIISRSLHTRMNKKLTPLDTYSKAIKQALETTLNNAPHWHSSLYFPLENNYKRHLYIFIGAQKGLCGNFNAEFLYWLEHNYQTVQKPFIEVITIGRRTSELLKKFSLNVIFNFEELKFSTVDTFTQELLKTILQANPFYTKVTIIGTQSHSFFSQRLHQTSVIPLPIKRIPLDEKPDDYVWLNKPEPTIQQLSHNLLKMSIYQALFETLLGEQAARFIAMDNATRNAENFTTTMKLHYNKLRQAKITKELTELATNF